MTAVGAPEGDAKDAPPPVQWPEGWQIQPDIIVKLDRQLMLSFALQQTDQAGQRLELHGEHLHATREQPLARRIQCVGRSWPAACLGCTSDQLLIRCTTPPALVGHARPARPHGEMGDAGPMLGKQHIDHLGGRACRDDRPRIQHDDTIRRVCGTSIVCYALDYNTSMLTENESSGQDRPSPIALM